MIGTALLLLLQLGSAGLPSDATVAGTLTGRVVSAPDGAAVVGATVAIGGLGLTQTTASDGAFIFDSIPAGRWELHVTADRRPSRTLAVFVPEGDTVRVDIQLEPPSEAVMLRGRILDAFSGVGLPTAGVTDVATGATVTTDRQGEFALEVEPAPLRVTLRIRSLGYAPRDTTVATHPSGGELRISLSPQPLDLIPLTVRVDRAADPADVERALFDREPRPGVIGIGGDELRQLPFLVQRDLLRSLQALPGVVRINDFSARLHVQGGGPDQNLFLLDDAPLIAPYHLFGIFGVLEPSTVSRVEFYRGSVPARYGGALSSVLEVRQRTDSEGGSPDIDLGLGLLSARVVVTGRAANNRIRWMTAARRSVSDLALKGLRLVNGDAPFFFVDGQARAEWTPTPNDAVRASVYASEDDFTMFLKGSSADLFSSWSNRVASIRWDHDFGGSWALNVLGRHSGYGALLRVGGAGSSPLTRNEVAMDALAVEVRRRGMNTGLRLGAEVEATSAEVDGGAREGGYVEGRAEGSQLLVSGWAELEQWIGPVRFSPGVRAAADLGGSDRLLAGPRISARVQVGDDTFLTAGVGRTHQLLSTLRDDRYPVPGAPIWFLRSKDHPVSTSDQAALSLDGWYRDVWSGEISLWGRRFRAVPAWRPEGDRTPLAVTFDDGHALGVEAMVRRHGGAVHGWLGYTVGRSVLNGANGTYDAAWDRRHSVELATFWETSRRTTLSARISYGTGTPFWPQVGEGRALWLDGRTGDLAEREFFPLWSDEQLRFPSYFRVDLGARGLFHIGTAEIAPYASIANVTGRANVFYYDYQVPFDLDGSSGPVLVPVHQLPFTILPSLGIDVRF